MAAKKKPKGHLGHPGIINHMALVLDGGYKWKRTHKLLIEHCKP